MTKPSPQKVAAKIAPNPADFSKRVNQLALDSRNIGWTDHAWQRMEERDISIRTATSVLREGMVSGPVVAGRDPNEWKAKLVQHIRGRRDIGAAVVLVRNNKVVVKNVEWEDR